MFVALLKICNCLCDLTAKYDMHMLPLFSIPCRHSVEAVSFQGSLVGVGVYHSTEERYIKQK